MVDSGGGNVEYRVASGDRVGIAFSGGGYAVPAWLGATLTATPSEYTLTDNKTQAKQIFDRTSGGRITAVRDRNGRALTYAYNALQGDLHSVTDSAGRVLELVYATVVDERRVVRVDQKQSASGQTLRHWDLGYSNQTEKLISYTDPEAGVYRYGYDANNRLEDIEDPRGKHTRFTYDSSARTANVVRNDGGSAPRTTSFSYASSPSRMTSTNARGYSTVYETGADGQGVAVTDQRGRRRSTSYTSGLLVQDYTPASATTGLSGAVADLRQRQQPDRSDPEPGAGHDALDAAEVRDGKRGQRQRPRREVQARLHRRPGRSGHHRPLRRRRQPDHGRRAHRNGGRVVRLGDLDAHAEHRGLRHGAGRQGRPAGLQHRRALEHDQLRL